MRLLILGGTLFVGLHVVEQALARGHAVTLFTRGRRPARWGSRVVALAGDRDPALAPGLAALTDGRWDAVIDTSGYVPRVVDASAALLARNVERYLFVSSVSVYADASRPGVDETGAVGVLDDPASEALPKDYGPLKAACEAVVRERYGERATIVRPGLIVGPDDPTDRFTYWPARFVHPQLLGARGPQAVVPAPRQRPIQAIDVRDLAAFLLDLVEQRMAGTFNACSPAGQWTLRDLVDACIDAAKAPPRPVWIDDAMLLAHHVEPWTGLPLWIPASDATAAGFMAIDAARARAAGLRTRSMAQTVRDTAAWLATRDNSVAWKHTLSAAREQLILAAYTQLRHS